MSFGKHTIIYFFQRHCLFKEELENVHPCKIWAVEGIKDRRIYGQSSNLRELITKFKLMLIAEEKNMMNESVQQIQPKYFGMRNMMRYQIVMFCLRKSLQQQAISPIHYSGPCVI